MRKEMKGRQQGGSMEVITSFEDFEAHQDEVREWLLKNGVKKEDVEHVLKCLRAAIAELYGEFPCGDFMRAILKNDLMETIFRADDINIHYIPVYVRFLFWYIPFGDLWKYRKKEGA